MSAGPRTPVKVAVVGHTNTGKTSLMRTLLRDVSFGEVSDHPATTRHVEGAALLVDGEALLELYDTPGLEDSIGLLERLDEMGRRGGPSRPDWPALVESFLQSPAAQGDFSQECKALRQVLASDIALYVIDARERVLGKHRDELEILTRCARPIVPVLNFTASASARTQEWRDQLARLNLHAVAEFDTVVLDEHGERRLFETMQTLLAARRDTFGRLIEDRRRLRERVLHSAARVAADVLIDAAAAVALVRPEEPAAAAERIDAFKAAIRETERRGLRQLLDLLQFRQDDGRLRDMPIEGGHWGLDLFSPEALKQFGLRAGGPVAAGAAAGLVLDVMLHGLSLGAGTATGAAIGALWQAGRSFGRRLIDRARGYRELRCDEGTLRLLLARQVALLRTLLHRGHADMGPVIIEAGPSWEALARGARQSLGRGLPRELLEARANPHWSRLAGEDHRSTSIRGLADAGRAAAQRALAERIVGMVRGG